MKFKPCPFCGEKEIGIPEFALGDSRGKYWVVSCPGCGAEGPSGVTLNIAIEEWNRRKT